jgi:predicted amidohydrolase YtcJ
VVIILTYDILFRNGHIITCNNKNDIYQWFAVKDGFIKKLGANEPNDMILENSEEIVDLNGNTVLPGFYDTHVHLVQTGLNYLGLDLYHVTSLEELFQKISTQIKHKTPGTIIRGYHFDVTKVLEKRFPTRKELDKVSPSNPIWINSIEFHTSALNTSALTMIDLPYHIDGIARDERNLPMGLFTGKASAFVRNRMLKRIDDRARMKGVSIAVQNAIKMGVTTIHAMEGGFTFHEKDAQFIFKNSSSFPIDILLYYQTFDLEKINSMNLKRLGGDIFLDGSFGSRTAAISSEYSDDPNNKGSLYFSQKELNYFVKEAHQKDLQIALHAIGDRAIDQALKAYEYAISFKDDYDNRHRIEHFELSDESHMKRASNMNLVISVQPAFEHRWGFKDGMYEHRLGIERARRTNNFRKMVDHGLKLCGSSDSDITSINPIYGIHCAVNHSKPEYSVTVSEAIKMFTINGAYSCHEEAFKGSLEENKLADFVILDQNPYTIELANIKDIQIISTYKEGIQIYSVSSKNRAEVVR